MKQLIIVILFNLTFAAFAADVKIYPGATCFAKDGGFDSDLERTGGEIINRSNIDRTVVCPVVTDITGDKSMNSIHLQLKGPNVTVVCKAVTKNKNDGTTYADNKTIYASTTSGSLGVGFDFKERPISSTSEASYYIECNLPKNASVVRYQTTE